MDKKIHLVAAAYSPEGQWTRCGLPLARVPNLTVWAERTTCIACKKGAINVLR